MDAGPTPPEIQGPPARRAELDLLRGFVVVGLVVFHSAILFDSATDWFVKNDPTSDAFAVFVLWASLWGMPLLFLVSGMRVRCALRTRTAGAFVRERLGRLLVPLVFGVVVLVPPMFHLGRLAEAGFNESYVSYWLRFLDVGPQLGALVGRGTWTSGGEVVDPAHLWFVSVLLVFSFVLLPVFLYLRDPSGSRWLDRLGSWFEHPGVVLLAAVPLALSEAVLGGGESTGGWDRGTFGILLL